MITEIHPFQVAVPQDDLDDLRRRLAATRLPRDVPGTGWERGVPVDYLRDLLTYWTTDYDWRRHEADLNRFDQYTTTIDGQTIHFLHVRSSHEDATPLLLIHGWPGTVVEFVDLIGPLTGTEPTGTATPRPFHVVVPSLPGHGFSVPLSSAGWDPTRIASALAELMRRLGYERFGVQGGDHGAFIAPEIGRLAPERVIGVHVNALVTFPAGDGTDRDGLDETDLDRLERFYRFNQEDNGYLVIHGTRPQTLGFALSDSPAGQLAWILEKFKEWTNAAHELPHEAVDRDRILTDASIYWFTVTGADSAHLYYEMGHSPAQWAPKPRGTVPTGVLVAPTDIAIRRYAERDHNIVHWTDSPVGGHFLALEQPDVFLADLRAFFDAVA